MAFHMPTQQVQRPRPRISPESSIHNNHLLNAQESPALEDSQEWVVFSPGAASVTTRTISASTIQTQRTHALSRFSDFGSLGTRAGQSVSYDDEDELLSPNPNDEDEDLESLDSHLPAFREPSFYRSRRGTLADGVNQTPVLPQHDGLGMFPASSTNVQEHIFQFEQFNPRRIVTNQQTGPDDNETFQRIQSWRLEQSQALLDEIEKETRRRRLSRSTSTAKAASVNDPEEDNATLGLSQTENIRNSRLESEGQSRDTHGADQSDSLWKRITRKVIRDLIGLDESLLSAIFGDTLAEDMLRDHESLDDIPEEAPYIRDVRSWEQRLLERVAVELGTLVSHFTEHPGAFSTYSRVQHAPEYVGATRLPLIPEHKPTLKRPLSLRDIRSESQRSLGAEFGNPFKPTLRGQSLDDLHVPSPAAGSAMWGANEHGQDYGMLQDHENGSVAEDSESFNVLQQREHWEKDLDVKVLLSFFRARFTNQSETQVVSQSPNLASMGGQRAAARAAAIRHHHPLASNRSFKSSHQSRPWYHHTHSARRPSSPLTTSGAANNLVSGGSASGMIRRSSCASISTKVSGRRAGSGSSRNFWDLGGSSSSARGGSAILVTGGGWGDV
jgi:hypothetical protein